LPIPVVKIIVSFDVFGSGWVKWIIGRIYFYFRSIYKISAGRRNWDVDGSRLIKINGGHQIKLSDGFPQTGLKDMPEHRFIFKLDLSFGWMNIDVNRSGIYIKIEEIGRDRIRW
jgi:hypothetical protein